MKKIIIVILTLTLFTFTLSGCSNNSQVQQVEQGIIKGKIQISDNQINSVPDISVNSIPENEQVAQINTMPLETVVYNQQDYIIKFTRDLSENEINKKVLNKHGEIISRISENNTYKFRLKNNDIELLNDLRNNPLVAYIEPDYLVHIQTIPDDPDYNKQWNLQLLGLEKTWENNKGNSQITVAVVDTGILATHPDLRDKIVPGYDFIDGDNDPTDTDPDFSHGTHVAGIIGAMTDNSQGVAGVNWNVKIMPVRVIGPDGNGGYSNLISGIYWAVDNGADVINLSLAGSVDSSSLKEAVEYAVDSGVTVVAAAGNNGSSPILYPARYEKVISVGAIGPDKDLAYYSNYGQDLDLVAPGGDNSVLSSNYNTILSTAGYMNGSQQIHKYSWAQGTSMAAPHVSGLVSLMYGAGITDPHHIKDKLKKTADDLGPAGEDEQYGAGLVNINSALNLGSGNYEPSLPDDNSNNDDSNNDSPAFEDVKVFAARDTLHGLERVTEIINPDNSGNFILEIDPGTWVLVGWIDSNSNGIVDRDDYYDHAAGLSVQEKGIISDIVLNLNRIE